MEDVKIGDKVWFCYTKAPYSGYTYNIGEVVDIELRLHKQQTCVKLQNALGSFWVFIYQIAPDEETIRTMTKNLNAELIQNIEVEIQSCQDRIKDLQNKLSAIETEIY